MTWKLLAICMCLVSPMKKPQPVLEKHGTYLTYEACLADLHALAQQGKYSGIACNTYDPTTK